MVTRSLLAVGLLVFTSCKISSYDQQASQFFALAEYCKSSPLKFNEEFKAFFVDRPSNAVLQEIRDARDESAAELRVWASVLMMRLHIATLVIYFTDRRIEGDLRDNEIFKVFYEARGPLKAVGYMRDGPFFGDAEIWLEREKSTWKKTVPEGVAGQVSAWLDSLSLVRYAVVIRGNKVIPRE